MSLLGVGKLIDSSTYIQIAMKAKNKYAIIDKKSIKINLYLITECALL